MLISQEVLLRLLIAINLLRDFMWAVYCVLRGLYGGVQNEGVRLGARGQALGYERGLTSLSRLVTYRQHPIQ